MKAVFVVAATGVALVMGLVVAFCWYVVVRWMVEGIDRRRNQAHLLRKDGAR